MRACLLRLLVALLTLASVAPAVAQGEPETEARLLFESAVVSMQNGRCADAIEMLERSLELVERVSTAYNLAVCRQASGQPLEAGRLYEAILEGRYGTADEETRRQSTEFLAAVRSEVATLRIHTLETPTARVTVDGREVTMNGGSGEVQLDPGEHIVRATATGHVDVDQQVLLARGAQQIVRLTLAPATGTLIIDTDDADAVIRVEGQPEAIGRFVATLPVRDYRVRAAFDEGDVELLVTVAEGRRVRRVLQAPAGGRSVWRSPWFWTVAGVLVAGAAVGLSLARRERSSPVFGNPHALVQSTQLR